MNLTIIYSQLLRLWVARRRQRRWWVGRWISLWPEQGAYGNLMMLLRNEDVAAFHNFTRLSPQLLLDLVERITPRLHKEDTWNGDSLEVGLEVAITLHHLQVFNVSILCSTQHHLHFSPDVCQAIWDEYDDEVVSNPTTAEGRKEIAASYSSPCTRYLGWQAHSHTVSYKWRVPVLQL